MAEQFEGAVQLLEGELVVLADDRYRPVEVRELPLVVGDVAGRVQRGAVRPEEDELLVEAKGRQIQLPGVLVVGGLVEVLQAGDDVVGRAVPHEPRLLDELVEVDGQPL